MYPKSIQKLIDQFSKFPTVGPRTAARFVFYLLTIPKEEISELIELIKNLSQDVKICSFCFKSFEGEGNLCEICSDAQRDKIKLCIVEKETDLESLEKTKKYNGFYFILGGTIPILKKEKAEIRISELIDRIKNPVKFYVFNGSFREIIIATNPTTEGEATALYLERKLKPAISDIPGEPIKITKLGRGLPIGGELEYADEETLGSALEGRK